VAKRKKASKVQKRGKLPRGNQRGKTRKAAKAAKATKRTIASAKPKRAVKKAAPKVVRRMKKPTVETVIVDLIEQPVLGRQCSGFALMRSLITLSFKARPKWRAFFCRRHTKSAAPHRG
jgi:hypothetical protein